MPKGRRTLPAAHPLPTAAGVSFDVGKVQTGPGLCPSRAPAASRPAPHGAGGTGGREEPGVHLSEGKEQWNARSAGQLRYHDAKKTNSFKYRRKQNTRPKAGSASHPSPSLTRTQRRKKTLSKAPSGFRNQSRKEKKNTATGAFQSDQLCTCSETHT